MTKQLASLLSLVLIVGVVQARITGTAPTNADVWCSGPSGSEVCVDASGNVVPTTASTQDLGTSAIPFRNAYIDGSLTLAAGAIDTAKIGADAVTTVKLINSAVDTSKLATDSVTTIKILTAAVDTDKLAPGSVSTAKIVDGAVDTGKLATDSVTSIKILTSAVDTNKIATGSIDTSKVNFVNVGTIDSGKIVCIVSGANPGKQFGTCAALTVGDSICLCE